MNIAEAIYRTTYRLKKADNQREWDEMCGAEAHLQFLIGTKIATTCEINKQIEMLREKALECGFKGGLIYAKEYQEGRK